MVRGSLAGQVVLVTGGSRGLGRAIATEVASHGASVVCTFAREREAAEQVVREITGSGASAIAIQVDVTDYQQVQGAISQTVERFGRLTGIINNAAIVRDRTLMMMTPSDWEDVIRTNLTGTFNTCKAAIVTLLKQRYGRIVNISSVAGVRGIQGQINYSASKAGMLGLTRSLAKEVAPFGITVNAIAPGYIDAGMAAGLPTNRKEEVAAQIPMHRFGTANEIASAVAFLLSDRAAYITGHVLVIDGGLSL